MCFCFWKTRIRGRTKLPLLGLAVALVCLPRVGSAAEEPWERQALLELGRKYLAEAVPPQGTEEPTGARLESVARQIGERLAASGTQGAPAEDVAVLALLLARQKREGVPPGTIVSPPSPSTAPLRAAQAPSATPVREGAPPGTPQPPGQTLSDIGKGLEGFRQGVEHLRQLPLSDRMVITGDITSGLQAATVTGGADLTSTFGRARVNVVARAVPGSADGRFGEGYFFLQMRAAGGAFDSSPVGGPRSFSPFNDVATDRSRYNEGTSRGNLYLAKTFYQQQLRLGEGYAVGRVGILDLSDYFDTNEFANNEARQFLSSALVTSAAYKSAISAPGLMVEYHREVRGARVNGAVVRLGYGLSRTERAFTSPLWTGELELQTALHGYRGHWRAGGTLGNVAGFGSVKGFHLNFDQWFSGSLGMFGRYAFSNASAGSLALGPVRQSYSLGWQRRFVDREDRVSAWALGFSQAFPILREAPLASERVLETYYRWQLTQNFALTPDFQLVLGSGGRPKRGVQPVFGLRANFGL
jgi:hypothetical protein